MKVCTCPRCEFFAMVALDLLALGDVENAARFAAEVTIFPDSDGEGYTDAWTAEDRADQARAATEYARDSREVN